MSNRPQAASQPTKSAFGSVTTRSGRPGFYLRFRWAGRRLWRYAGPRRDVAAKNLSRVHALLSDGRELEEALGLVFDDRKATGYTFRDATDDYLAWAETWKKPSTVRMDRWRLKAMGREPWTGQDLHRISRTQIQRHLDARLADGNSAGNVNRDAAIIGALFKWAVGRGHVRENPCRGLVKPSEAGNAREVYLTAAEANALVTAAEEPFRSILLCAFHTGMRRAEILGLRWPAVDLDTGTLRVSAEAAKTREGRTVPLTPQLRARLAEMRTACGNVLNALVFAPDVQGEQARFYLVRTGLSAALGKAKGIEAAKAADFHLHDARHTAASLMVAQGIPLFDAGKILGHRTVQTTLRYAHFAPEAGRAAIAALGRALA